MSFATHKSCSKMFSRRAVFSILALPFFAAATPTARNDTPTTACCASTESVRVSCLHPIASSHSTLSQANSAAGAAILKAIGVDLSDLNVLLGLTCSPISVVGIGSGSECSGTTVSCSDGVVVSLISPHPKFFVAHILNREVLVSAAFPSSSR